jgi:hypothetical protein
MNVQPSETERPTLKHADPTVQVIAVTPGPQRGVWTRQMLQGRAAQTLTAILMASTLSALLWWCLPAIEQFWQTLLTSLLGMLAMEGMSVSQSAVSPAWMHLGALAVTAPIPVPGMNILGIHVLGALCLVLIAGWLRPPFRSSLRLFATLHVMLALACVSLPGGARYSIEDHTRCLTLFTEALLLALPVVMAFTHYIIEYNLERRVVGTTLIAGYLVLTLPLKLVAHALLIRAGTGLAEPTLFLVFGPALDIFMVTAIYAWIVTWRHHHG